MADELPTGWADVVEGAFSLPNLADVASLDPVTKNGDVASLDTDAYPRGAYPDGAYPNGAYPDGAYPNGAYPNGAYPNGAYPDGAYSNGDDASAHCRHPRQCRGCRQCECADCIVHFAEAVVTHDPLIGPHELTDPADLHKDRMTKAEDVEAEATSRGEEPKTPAMAKKVLKHDKLKRAQQGRADVVAFCETLSACRTPPASTQRARC